MDWHYEDVPVNSVDDNLSLGILGKPVYESNSVKIIDSPGFGRVLYINGSIQTCEFDEYIYHEMMVHPAFSTQANPKKILIIGGGDGGTLREVLKYDSVEKVDFVEVSKEVIEASIEHLKFTELEKNIQDPRVNVYIGDGAKFIKSANFTSYDAILIDGNDPVGPAISLYTPRFIKDCRDRLALHGVLAIQCGYHLTSPKFVKKVRHLMRRSFRQVEYLSCPILTYPSGGVGFLVGNRGGNCKVSEPPASTKYYDAKTLKASLITHELFRKNSRHEKFKLIYEIFDWSKIIRNHADLSIIKISNGLEGEPSCIDGVNIPLVKFSVGTDGGKPYYKLRVLSLSGIWAFKEALAEKRGGYPDEEFPEQNLSGFEWDSRDPKGGNFIFSLNFVDSIKHNYPNIYSNFPDNYHNLGFLDLPAGGGEGYSSVIFQPKRLLKITKEGIEEHKMTKDVEAIKRKASPLIKKEVDFLEKGGLTPSSLMYKDFQNYEIGFDFD